MSPVTAQQGRRRPHAMELDPLIHERVRLGILSTLAAVRDMSFTDLRDHLGVTDGNLSIHARILQRRGLLRVEKTFVNDRPHTRYSLTEEGRAALDGYIRKLEAIVKQG